MSMAPKFLLMTVMGWNFSIVVFPSLFPEMNRNKTIVASPHAGVWVGLFHTSDLPLANSPQLQLPLIARGKLVRILRLDVLAGGIRRNDGLS